MNHPKRLHRDGASHDAPAAPTQPAAAPAKARPRDKYQGLPGRWSRDPATGERTPADDTARAAVAAQQAAQAQHAAVIAAATEQSEAAASAAQPPAEGQ